MTASTRVAAIFLSLRLRIKKNKSDFIILALRPLPDVRFWPDDSVSLVSRSSSSVALSHS